MRSSVNSSLPDSIALVMAISTYSRSSPLNSPMEFQFREKRSDESMTKGLTPFAGGWCICPEILTAQPTLCPFIGVFRGLRDCEKDSDELSD